MFELLHPSVQHHVVNSLGWPGLRPLQEAAIEPLLAGEDALLLAPTAGGKTEAALFPLLTKMAGEGWRGSSLLYLCPLRALLNNLEYRVGDYAGWLGRTAGVRHGDTGQARRRRLALERPDVLLTTPESLEAMLVSATLDPRILLADVRAVVVDEIHAFAGDDRGWHLLAVLERLEKLTDRSIQRVGLSATVGNPQGLFEWLQAGRNRPGGVINPSGAGATSVDLGLDYVGTLGNAALVSSQLGVGEKRLVFTDSRRTVEELASELRELQVETYVSHSSLSVAERHRAEKAFAEASDCVIVSTSTLELGIDVGDLDRVLQIGAPSTVASLLQRLGRTGRRPGTRRNMQLLATDDLQLLRGAALTLLWAEGYVEPIVAPPTPLHLAAQQVLALALQEGRVGTSSWQDWLGNLNLGTHEELAAVTNWLIATGHIDVDQGLMFVGPEAERKYGRRHFMELMTVFTSSPQMTVFFGKDEVGTIDPTLLLMKVEGPRLLALAGRTWKVTSVEWQKRRVWVEPADGRGEARWTGQSASLPFALANAVRRVLLGEDPAGVLLSQRATQRLALNREELAPLVDATRRVVVRDEDSVRWWTWAGRRANATLEAALSRVAPQLVGGPATFDDFGLELDPSISPNLLRQAMRGAAIEIGAGKALPAVSEQALVELKFSDLLPPHLAESTLARRLTDNDAALKILADGAVWRHLPPGGA